VYENDTYQSVSGSLTEGSFSITWDKQTTPALYRWGVKFNSTLTTRWVNGSYDVSSSTFQVSDPTVTTSSTTVTVSAFANLAGNYYVYSNDSYQSVSGAFTAGSVVTTWNKLLAEALHTWGVKYNTSSGVTRWVNGSYDVTSSTFLISDPTVSGDTSTLTVSCYANLAGNYYVYSNDTYQSVTGSFSAGSVVTTWSKLTNIGLHVWGVKYNTSGGITRWINGSYDVTSTSFTVDWNFGVTDTKVFVTGYKTLPSSYTVYEDDSSISSGTITSLSFWLEWTRQQSTTPAAVDVAVKFINGSTTIWTNFSYTEAQLSVFRIEVYDFYLSDVFVNGYIRTTWNNATIYAYDNGSLVGTFSEGSFYWYKDTDIGIHLLEFNVTSGTNIITLNPAYYVPNWSDTALAFVTFNILNMQENYTLLTVTTNWQNCTVDVWLNGTKYVSNGIEGLINFTRPTNTGLYNLTVRVDGGTQWKSVSGWIYISPQGVSYDYRTQNFQAGGSQTNYIENFEIDNTIEPILLVDETAGEWLFWSVIMLMFGIPMAVLIIRIVKPKKGVDKQVEALSEKQFGGFNA
jgi:hypothetical protein